ncbi:MAG: HDOD domain-containing protein [Methylococcales bacterium]|nr:HDOD domain-containing protein [Methylococcales bacterium]MDD5753498.1 HDOD domain-containing protein [Methylococcales bacterium]
MASWASSLFSKKKVDIKEVSAESLELAKAADLPVVSGNTKPATVSNSKQPLAVLKKLAPIRDLKDEDLAQIEQSVLSYPAKSTVFTLGEKSEHIYYLLKGGIELESNGGASYFIAEGAALANLPLNSGKICGATARTKEPSVLLSIPTTVVQWWVNKSKSQQQGNNLEVIDIELPKEIPDTQFFKSFAQAYRENKLSLPSLPQVAIKLRKAMEKDDIGIRDVIKIIEVDAPIVAKLIQVSNSALYASSTPIKNCHDAVTRLGLETTRKLVMGISVKQLFQSKSPQLMAKMQELWKKSLHVSSLSFVLAQESGDVNPEDALLAGLICDIGAIPLIHFAEQNPESYPDLNDLQTVMPYLNPPVGSLVLHTLGFSNEITEIPKHAEDWYYESDGDKLTLIDVVILAKLHSYFGTARAKELPYINSLPAYAKLKNGKLNPDFSLDILSKAQQRIDAAMSMFA